MFYFGEARTLIISKTIDFNEIDSIFHRENTISFKIVLVIFFLQFWSIICIVHAKTLTHSPKTAIHIVLNVHRPNR